MFVSKTTSDEKIPFTLIKLDVKGMAVASIVKKAILNVFHLLKITINIYNLLKGLQLMYLLQFGRETVGKILKKKIKGSDLLKPFPK